MKILALSWFDPASVVLSHRNLMRAAGHDFRLAVVRAYTERQRGADYVLSQLQTKTTPMGHGVVRKQLTWENVPCDLEGLKAFAREADAIQFHPGIGHGDGDWASAFATPHYSYISETVDVLRAFGVDQTQISQGFEVAFLHGSNNAWVHRERYATLSEEFGLRLAASTLDYATEMEAAYLPPFVDVGELRAPLRQADDPLIIAHTPTDTAACSTEAFLVAAKAVGALPMFRMNISHQEVLALKAGCHAGFDHLRGSFSVNTLENAALGLVPLFALKPAYRIRGAEEGILPAPMPDIVTDVDLADSLRHLEADWELTAALQQTARAWFLNNFNAAAVTKRLVRFYEGL